MFLMFFLRVIFVLFIVSRRKLHLKFSGTPPSQATPALIQKNIFILRVSLRFLACL